MKSLSLPITSSLTNKYQFGGKEIQNKEFSDNSGLEAYDYGWRLQDPQLGTWHNLDPLDESAVNYSPYSYCYDNPIRFIDPTGLKGENANNGDEDEMVHVLYLKNSSTGEITANQVSDAVFNKNTNGGQDFMADIHAGDGNYVYQNDNGKGQFQSKEYHGESSYTDGDNYHYLGHINWDKSSLLDENLDKANKTIGGFNVGWGMKQELFDFAVRDRAGLSRSEFNNLSNTEREVTEISALGSKGVCYLKLVKGIGITGFAASTGISVHHAISYYANGGKGYGVAGKAGLDVAMGIVGFFGPIGFAISATYFILDAATDGFGSNAKEWNIKQ